ncbi:hypothetical protein P7K49_019386, partial [Saguinus oedipus]
EMMIKTANISMTAGDALEEEAEVFQGVEIMVANPPSLLCSKIQTATHIAYLIIQNQIRLQTLMPANLITVLTGEDDVLMDGMTESDTASVNENGLGKIGD